jgi:hypothetical protein
MINNVDVDEQPRVEGRQLYIRQGVISRLLGCHFDHTSVDIQSIDRVQLLQHALRSSER